MQLVTNERQYTFFDYSTECHILFRTEICDVIKHAQIQLFHERENRLIFKCVQYVQANISREGGGKLNCIILLLAITE